MMRNQLWEQIPNLSPPYRSSHTSTLIQDDYLITYGGETIDGDVLSDIMVLNLKTCSFEDFTVEGDQPCQRKEHTACLFDTNKILIFGGVDKDDTLFNDISIISLEQTAPLKLKYKKVNTINGEVIARCGHTANMSSSQLTMVFGGLKQDSPSECSNELWRLDVQKFKWELCATTGTKPEGRAYHSSAIENFKFYIFGGYSPDRDIYPHNFFILPFRTMEWQKSPMKENSFLSRDSALSVCFGDNIFIIGGSGNYESARNEMVTYNFKENTFTCHEANGDYSEIHSGAAVVYKSSLIIWGDIEIRSPNDECLSQILRLRLNQAYGGSLYEGKACIFPDYMKNLLCSEQFADIHFMVEDEKIPAHKLVLCLRCKYFANLFTSKMKESHLTEIEIKDVKLQTFKAFLGFLYQNEIELTEALAVDLYQVSDKYLQKELASLCEEFLSKNLTLDNFLSMIDFTENLGTTTLKKAILKFIASNFQKIERNQNNFLIPYPYLMEVAVDLHHKLQVKERDK